LNINYWGCDKFDAGYYSYGSSPKSVQTPYGQFNLPVCNAPLKRPMASLAIFVLFILVCGFILVSLTVAFVTTGINNRLKQMKEREDVAENEYELRIARERNKVGLKEESKSVLKRAISKYRFIKNVGGSAVAMAVVHPEAPSANAAETLGGESTPSPPRTLEESKTKESSQASLEAKGSFGSDSSSVSRKNLSSTSKKLAGTKTPDDLKEVTVVDRRLMRALLMQVWTSEGGGEGILKSDEPTYNRNRRQSLTALKLPNQQDIRRLGGKETPLQKMVFKWGVVLRPIVVGKYYVLSISALIIASAIIELLLVQGTVERSFSDLCEIPFQFLFSADLLARLISHAPKFRHFLENSWNLSDSVLVVLLWIPVLSNSSSDLFGMCFFCRLHCLKSY
jgi:hypothetical protein